ncbi:MAG: aminotransferase class III-fold pyridoxal phosphate-dependent enzyme [Myxococcaceae bacterium]
METALSLAPSAEPTPRSRLLSVAASLFRAVNVPGRAWERLLLSRAKHRSLAGHPRMALRLSRWVPNVEYDATRFFSADGAPAEVERQRRSGFDQLSHQLRARAPRTLQLSAELEHGLSDVAFVNAYRVPFQFRRHVQEHLPVGTLVDETRGAQVRDLDGNWSYDLGGAYGVNLFNPDFYKGCIERGSERVKALGPVLGAFHPVIADNVRRLLEISKMDEISFHMSGTEAVMQAVRLARFHTRRTQAVRFCGAYHGWWDGVQAGPGNPLPARNVFTLRELDPLTLKVLASRGDIACVLVNPLQAMHPNGTPPTDSMLVASDRRAAYDKEAYRAWLLQLREICTRRGIALIFDEVFLGFRLAPGGAQEYFGVQADLVTYGKTLGGGLPVGALCGKRRWMQRFREDRPADICFARGTFNSHPYVMGTMNEFLRQLEEPQVIASYAELDARWDGRSAALNARLAEAHAPVRVANMTSIWTTLYLQPSRYNWMLQFYLRAAGLSPSWIGTGRFIFSHDLSDADFEEIASRFVSGAKAMQSDGWWWAPASGGLTNQTLKRGVLKELLKASFRSGRKATDPASRL